MAAIDKLCLNNWHEFDKHKGSIYIIDLIGDGYVEQMLKNKKSELEEKFKEL